MRRSNVSVHLIEPGAFKTGLTDPQSLLDSLQMVWDRLPEEEKEAAGGEALHQVRECPRESSSALTEAHSSTLITSCPPISNKKLP